MVVVIALEADGSSGSRNPASALVSVIVLMPILRWPSVSSDFNVPSSVTPGTPGCNIVPVASTALVAAVILWSMMAGTKRSVGWDDSGAVFVLIIGSDGSNNTGTLDMV